MANSNKKVPEQPAIYPVRMEAGAEPIRTEIADCCVMVTAVDREGRYAKLRVLPKPQGITRILDARFGPMGWTCRRYCCGSALYCSIGVYNPLTNDYLHKDAPAAEDYVGADKALVQAASSFAHAAAQWGVCTDVLDLPTMTFTADQVELLPVPYPNDAQRIKGYRMRQILTVDRIARQEDDTIQAVQFRDQDGKVIVWQR